MRLLKLALVLVVGVAVVGCNSEETTVVEPVKELKQAEKVVGAGKSKPTMTDEQMHDLIKQYEEREKDAPSGFQL